MTSIGVRSSVDTDTDKVWGWTWSLFGVGVLRDDDESDKRYNAEKKTTLFILDSLGHLCSKTPQG